MRLESQMGLAKPTAADQEECARVLSTLDGERRRAAAFCGETAPAPRPDDWLGNVRFTRQPLTEIVAQVLDAGRQRARMLVLARAE